MGRIQIRDLPENIYQVLKARAQGSHMSLSAYLRTQFALIASRPTPEDLEHRLQPRRRGR